MKVISDINIIDSVWLNVWFFFILICCSVVLMIFVVFLIMLKYVFRNDFDIVIIVIIILEIDSYAGVFGSIESVDKMVIFFFLVVLIYEGGIESR